MPQTIRHGRLLAFLTLALPTVLAACGPKEFDATESIAGTAKAERDCRTVTASWYGSRFHGRKAASGETFDMHAMTAAHRELPFGTKVHVSHGGKAVTVRINDRGPFSGGRGLDLSRAAADRLGIRHAGTAPVCTRVLSYLGGDDHLVRNPRRA